MCREHSGSNDYFQLKSLAQIKPKRRDIIQRNVEEEDKIEVKNVNIFSFMSNKINEKRKNYLIKEKVIIFIMKNLIIIFI